jgi:RNA polymerase sigma-70 factor (ECF subfamily)
MIPLSEQDVRLWDRRMIGMAANLMRRAADLGRSGPYQLLAAIHAVHAARLETGQTAWSDILALYDMLLGVRPWPIVEVNRAVAVAEVQGSGAGLAALDAVSDPERLAGWLPYQVARASLCAAGGRRVEATMALRAALALGPAPSERLFLESRLSELGV